MQLLPVVPAHILPEATSGSLHRKSIHGLTSNQLLHHYYSHHHHYYYHYYYHHHHYYHYYYYYHHYYFKRHFLSAWYFFCRAANAARLIEFRIEEPIWFHEQSGGQYGSTIIDQYGSLIIVEDSIIPQS